ncbi:MAG: MarR family winged helix-turn-helix transcriptional regulator [Janthinobacterium lividum]
MAEPPCPAETDALLALYGRPGFMIRRAHQIATSLFVEAAGPLGATTTQYGVLTVLRCQPGIDQITLARRLGLDRSTAGSVLRTLEATGLVTRVTGPDRRRRTLQLTAAGDARLAALQSAAALALERLLAPLTASEAETLRRLLDKLTGAHNSTARVPLAGPESMEPVAMPGVGPGADGD